MTTVPDADANPTAARRRMIRNGVAVVACALLVPALLIPFLMWLFHEPAVRSLDELDPAQVAGVGVFVLNRPDDGPDVGSTKELFAVPAAKRTAVLATLQGAEPVPAARAVFLGRLVLTLADGRKQEIILNRYEAAGKRGDWRLRFHIERRSFDAGPVGPFLKALDEANAGG